MENNTYTFICSDKKHQFTISKSFFKGKHRESAEELLRTEDLYNLMTLWNLRSYLHNPTGPAIVNLETGTVQYFLNGNQEQGEKLKYDLEFYNHVDDFLKYD